MANPCKWRILLCVLLIVASVVLTCLAVACTQDTQTPDTPATDTESDGGNEVDSESETIKNDEPIVLPPLDNFGGYERTDTDGIEVFATAMQGTVGDLSSYTSISSVVTLGDSG